MTQELFNHQGLTYPVIEDYEVAAARSVGGKVRTKLAQHVGVYVLNELDVLEKRLRKYKIDHAQIYELAFEQTLERHLAQGIGTVWSILESENRDTTRPRLRAYIRRIAFTLILKHPNVATISADPLAQGSIAEQSHEALVTLDWDEFIMNYGASLNETQRTIVFMRFIKSIAVDEIARGIGISERSVYRRIASALSIIERLIREHYS